MSVNQAEAELLLRPQRSAEPLLKLLRSAVANAKHNKNLEPEKLIIQSIVVDKGPMLKRFFPRAMGRATMIQKKMSHITLILSESEKSHKKFTLIKPQKEKKTKLPKKEKQTKQETSIPAMEKKSGLAGKFTRLFNRKTG